MTYKEFIDDINCGNIKGINFYIDGYSHYNNCSIMRTLDKSPSGNDIILIQAKLTKDSSEEISFLNNFNENYKIFRLGRKGTFTLKQIWERVCITQIYNS